MIYSEKLSDARWCEKRDLIVAMAGHRCEDCGATWGLEVHHCIYIKGLEPWEYDEDLLICVCAKCHMRRQEKEIVARVSLARLMRLMTAQELESGMWELAFRAAIQRTAIDYAEAFA